MQAFAASLVELPIQLQAVIAVAVMFGVRYLLGRFNLPEDKLSEIAAMVTTVILTTIGALLGLIPPEFAAVATAILNLLGVLLGGVIVVNGYLKARKQGFLK